MIWAVIACGSALGGMARYGVGLLAEAAFGGAFPWGTLLINIGGSFVIGFYQAISQPGGGPLADNLSRRAFVMAGFCGGFTTFSSFSLQTLTLLQDGEMLRAGCYIAGSVALCLAGVFLGYWLGTRFGLSA